jgi:ABC-type uncharacterized transport system substrate-binding protein
VRSKFCRIELFERAENQKGDGLTKRTIFTTPLCVALAVWASPASTHPHVLAEAKLNITITPDGYVDQLSHIWRFDDLFSETVMFEFDKDADGKINPAEQAEISKTIVESIGEYNYFEAVTTNGKEVKMAKPANLQASFDGKILVITFANGPVEKVPMTGKTTFGIYDPTFYTSIEFVEDKDVVVTALPATCKSTLVRPDADEALAQNKSSLTEAFFNDPQGTSWRSQSF